MRRARAFWIVSAIAACYLAAFSAPSFAADSSLAQASFLPDELKQLPPHITIVGDYSGYWAGENAPLVRCIEIEWVWDFRESMTSGYESTEIAEGMTMDSGNVKDLLAFYYLGENGAWKRIGTFSYYWISDIAPISQFVDDTAISLLKARISNGGNARAQKQVCCFAFRVLPDGSVKYHDKVPHIEGISIVGLYQKWLWCEPIYIAYPTLGIRWEVHEPFAHAGAPDRYILLQADSDGTLTNVSTSYPGYYLQWLGCWSFVDLLESVAHSRRILEPDSNVYYMAEIIQLLIAYHDMGYHDEGVRLARQLIKVYGYVPSEHFSPQELIDDTIANLETQDKLIRETIDNYSAKQRANCW